MFDKNYWLERKKELDLDFQKKGMKGLEKVINLCDEIKQDMADIQKKWQDIDAKEKEFEKELKEKK